jgi:hypothetical protein
MTTLAEQILSRKKTVTHFEMNGATYYAKKFNALDVKKFRQVTDPVEAAVTAIILGACEEDATPLFKAEQFDELMGLDHDIISALSNSVLQHSGLFQERETAKN